MGIENTFNVGELLNQPLNLNLQISIVKLWGLSDKLIAKIIKNVLEMTDLAKLWKFSKDVTEID